MVINFNFLYFINITSDKKYLIKKNDENKKFIRTTEYFE